MSVLRRLATAIRRALGRPARDRLDSSLRLRSDVRVVARADEWLLDLLRAGGVPDEAAYDLRLGLDEALANIIKHGYGDGAPGTISVRAQIGPEIIRLELSDRAGPFNPMSAPEPNLSHDIKERGAGGLGIFLLRRVMDRIDYTRADGENRLIMERRRTPGSRPG
jgi:anti-sigma regulatory factor (Ser/Thr protein kinase)